MKLVRALLAALTVLAAGVAVQAATESDATACATCWQAGEP